MGKPGYTPFPRDPLVPSDAGDQTPNLLQREAPARTRPDPSLQDRVYSHGTRPLPARPSLPSQAAPDDHHRTRVQESRPSEASGGLTLSQGPRLCSTPLTLRTSHTARLQSQLLGGNPFHWSNHFRICSPIGNQEAPGLEHPAGLSLTKIFLYIIFLTRFMALPGFPL